MGLIGDFFGVLFGAGYVTTRVVKEEIVEPLKFTSRQEAIRKYILENTDIELENKLSEDVKDPAKYDEIYERIEKFKMDNVDKQPRLSTARDWKDVGIKRLPVRDKKGRLYPPNNYDALILSDNRRMIVGMALRTYGKLSFNIAQRRAWDIYK